MRRTYARGVVAIEEEEKNLKGAADVAVPVEEVALDNAESVETELIDVAEVEAEGAAENAEVEEAGEVVEALESIAQALATSAANGGIDKHAAKAIGIATEHMLNRVGMKSKSMPALESFGGTSTRIGATQLALEQINLDAKKIWASIIAAFERAIQWAKDFFTKVFVSWEKLEKRAGELAAKADKAKGTAKVTSGGVVKGIVTSAGVPALAAGLKTYEDFVKEVFAATTTKAKVIDTLITELEKMSTPGSTAAIINIPGVNDWFHGLKEDDVGFPEAKEGLTNFASDEMFGGIALIAALPKEAISDKAAAAKAIGGVSFRMGVAKPDAKESAVKELPGLDAAGVKSVTDAVIAVAKEGLAYKAASKVVEEQRKKAIAAAKKISNAADSDKDARAVTMGIAKLLDQPAASAAAYSLRTAKALLDYVEESLKEPKAEKPAPAAAE